LGGKEGMITLFKLQVPEVKSDTDQRSLVGINRPGVFCLERARELYPIIFRITKAYVDRVDAVLGSASSPVQEWQEKEAQRLFAEWQVKVLKLGGKPNGVWVVDFDTGNGYLCWKFPEPEIGFWHAYHDGFSKRRQLTLENADENELSK